jgi:urease accessory protein
MGASLATAFRPTRWGAYLVGEAAHPVGGDDFYVRLDVGVGCCTEIRSFAPLVARPGPVASLRYMDPLPSSFTTNVTVARDAMLTWYPEPGRAAGRADHSNDVLVRLGANSRLLWVDEFELDDHEVGTPGTWRNRVRVTRDGWPAVACELAIGPGSGWWNSTAVLGGARAVISVVAVDPDHPGESWACDRAVSADGTVRGLSLPLSGPGAQFIVWGTELSACREALAQLVEPAGVPIWVGDRMRVTDRGSLRGVHA